VNFWETFFLSHFPEITYKSFEVALTKKRDAIELISLVIHHHAFESSIRSKKLQQAPSLSRCGDKETRTLPRSFEPSFFFVIQFCDRKFDIAVQPKRIA